MIKSPTEPEQRVLLHSVPWETFESLAECSDRAGRLMTYDEGDLEIMVPSRAHESDKSIIGRLVEMYSLHHGIDIASSASTTFKRKDLKRGFEADESYYIRNELAVRTRREIDLRIDPPPDLVIEVEMSKSSINKLAIYAEMGVPEVWRFNGETFWLGKLVDGEYQTISESIELPGFPVPLALETLLAVGSVSETELIRRFVKKLTPAG